MNKYKNISISCLLARKDHKTLRKTNNFINKELLQHGESNTENFYFSEKRQIDLIRDLNFNIKKAIDSLHEIEIACNYLNLALKILDNLYGKNNPEDKLEFIFKKFCIGK